MKRFQHLIGHYRGFTEGLLLLVIMGGILTGAFLGCGKLSDDTNRPTDPIGQSGAGPIPIKPEASYGNFSLKISADPESIPADGVNYTTVNASLEDASGRSVSGYQISFTADSLGFFSPTTGSSGYTDNDGHVSVRLLGRQSGSCVVEARADLDNDNVTDLLVRTTVTFTSGGIPASAGNYSFQVWATPGTVPADLATYSTIIAKLTDHSGGTVENFIVNFSTEDTGNYGLGYLHNGPEPPVTWSTTVNGTTNALGDSSVYFYGARRGSALVQACVTIPDLDDAILCDTVWISVTEGPGKPGDDVTGVRLTVDDPAKITEGGTCGEPQANEETFNFVARVWDETSDLVGSGVRVEIEGTGINNNTRTDYVTDSNGSALFSISYSSYGPGEYNMYLIASAVVNGVTYTDRVEYTWVVTCTEKEEAGIEIETTIEPTEIETNGQANISVLVTSEDAPVSGATVTFTHTQGLGTLVPETVETGADGLASTTFTAGANAGTATIYIGASSAEGDAGVSETITITNAPAAITAFAPSVSVTIGESVSATAYATVKDANGDFIEGASVAFTITKDSGCGGVTFSPTSGSNTTNAAGRAEFTFSVERQGAGTCRYSLHAVSGSVATSPDPTGTITE